MEGIEGDQLFAVRSNHVGHYFDTVIPDPQTGRPPNFSPVFKRQVVETTIQPGAFLLLIACKHEVNANLVSRWRHQYQEGAFSRLDQSATFLPDQVIEASTDTSQSTKSQSVSHSAIVIELAKLDFIPLAHPTRKPFT